MYTSFRRKLICLVLIVSLLMSLTAGCGTKDVTELMGSYAASDNVVNYDIGAMQGASFAPLLSQWFICDVTEDMLAEDYVFDDAKPKQDGAVFVIDRTNNRLLFGYKMLSELNPASITKLMTSLVVLKHCEPKETVTIDAEVAAMTRGSVAELNEGDVITVYNLLIVLLTISANNAALALSKHVAGSEAAFVEMMNDEIDHIGANKSHFENCSGLHLEKHKTTPYDMYVVYQECMKYPEFRSIMQLTSGQYDYTNIQGEQCVRPYETTNCFKLGKYPYPEGIKILGGKTGTTNAAGYCLILHVANSVGNEFLLGVFHCENEQKLYTKMADLLAQYCQ